MIEEKVPETIFPHPWSGLQHRHLPHQPLVWLILKSSQILTGVPGSIRGSQNDEERQRKDRRVGTSCRGNLKVSGEVCCV